MSIENRVYESLARSYHPRCPEILFPCVNVANVISQLPQSSVNDKGGLGAQIVEMELF
jgi:hypothetical protein